MAKKAYIGVTTEIPKYEITTETVPGSPVSITSSNIGTYFTVANGDYWFNGGSAFYPNNSGVDNSTAITELTAKKDMTVSFSYSCSSEENYDIFTITVAGTEVAQISGEATDTYSGSIKQGQTIIFDYTKDSSYSNGSDNAEFWNMTVVCPEEVEVKTQVGTEIKNVARKIKKGYIGINTEIPIYGSGTTNVGITASNISNYFTVFNGSYYFAGSGNQFITNNGGVNSSYASTTLTAKENMTVSFSYSYSSESGWDKFTLVFAGSILENAVSGATTTKTYSGTLTAGQTIVFEYTKDSSQHTNDDQCKFYNMSVTATGQVQTGSEFKEVARRIKKAYIGIGGKARPCWSGGELTYYGTVTALSAARRYLAATTIGDYALFGGGYAASSYSNVVDAYNKSLTRSTPTALSAARRYLAATTIGDYALFGGGQAALLGYSNVVDAYNKSLTRSTPTALSTARGWLAATTIGDYALFGGGYSSYSSVVNAYNKSLTRSTPTALSTARGYLAATTIGDYALFGGGYTGSYSKVVDAYNKSLTRSTPTTLSTARRDLAAASVGDYALFGGGYTGSMSSVVDAYNKSLTRSTPTALSGTRRYLAATSIGDYALFGGGENSYYVSVVNAYDKSLTRTSPSNLNTARCNLAATTVGDYVLFGGGYTGSVSAVVDAYTLV